MATYKDSGVDIKLGDHCSKIAYEIAKTTFTGRKGLIGEPVLDEEGFTGMLDLGEFYLIQNDDGVGTKIEVAEKMHKFDTIGYDLLAMVADDGICIGAEIISITNTLDIPQLDKKMVTELMQGLQKAALEQKIVIPGGELAELGNMLNGPIWNATAVGIIEKNKIITRENIQENDTIIALKSDGIRSNGLSLARMILKKKFGENWVQENYGNGKTWGEIILTPSKIYHRALLNLLGGYKEERKFNIKGIVHNTGGGIKGNLPRVLKKKGLGAELMNLPEPHEFMRKLQEIGNVSDEEAYKTWNMGVGMMLIINPSDTDTILIALKNEGIAGQVVGKVINGGEIKIDYNS
jgi:phosphoribosylformylglycinamidine cyclo-ligase